MPGDTIYAVSSGRPPAAIAVVRVSGPDAARVLAALAGHLPVARMATLRTLRTPSGEVLDRAIILWFPGPASATGEDVAELHLHGGSAVIAAVFGALDALGLRQAEPGEFTRRSVFNGRLDLNEAEGLADLLAAETEAQRRDAILRKSNVLGRRIQAWTERLLAMSAEVERAIDHDEDDLVDVRDVAQSAHALGEDIGRVLAWPSAERLRDGVRVAIVGPVNAGKSSLFNALVGEDAAIVTPMPGTTRDVVERAIVLDGYPFVLSDTAGRRESADPIERIGIARADAVAESADVILDLSADAITDERRLAIASKCDIAPPADDRLPVSAVTGSGIAQLRALLVARGEASLPPPGEVALNARQRAALVSVRETLREVEMSADTIIMADHLACACRRLDQLSGKAGVEDMLDALFSRFCLGK